MGVALLTKNISNRIDKKFNDLKEKKDNALICYVVAGYPDIQTSENIIVALIEGGADMIEIGGLLDYVSRYVRTMGGRRTRTASSVIVTIAPDAMAGSIAGQRCVRPTCWSK